MKKLISVIGSSGRMGQATINLLKNDDIFDIKSQISSNNINEIITNFEKTDIAIDFSNPSILDTILSAAVENNTNLVMGTTGYSKKDFDKIKKTSEKIAIFYSANFSIGILILNQFIKEFNHFLKDSFIDIIDIHHIHKKDSPSGTALTLKDQIKKYLKKDASVHSIRSSNVIGEHSLLFYNNEEKINIKHTVTTRDTFAKGAIIAAKFIKDKKNGFFTMSDLFKKGKNLCM